jgi:hypothetical protein
MGSLLLEYRYSIFQIPLEIAGREILNYIFRK